MGEQLTVGQVAERFGVTRRTLHHYDEIGLVTPSARTCAGYRLYAAADLERLQHVVVYRRLGFALEAIAALLAHPESAVDHLRRQREAVAARLGELSGLVVALDHALEEAMNDRPLTDAEKRELFGDAWNDDYQAEAEQRWGETPQWKQSQERQKTWTKADWQAVKDEAEAVEAELGRLMDAGARPGSPEADALAEQHLAGLRRHYDCGHGFHVNLARMYVADPRFTAYYDAIRPGGAQFLHDVIVANAAGYDD